MNHIIFDLDGTLADCTHRVPLLPDWDAFYSACDKDSPIWPVIDVYDGLLGSFGRTVHIWSGRRETELTKTLYWFDEHGIQHPDNFRMRLDGDHRSDTIVKGQWLDAADFVPSLVFEDRTSVVQMYRDRGIQVCQVAPGDF